MTIDVQTGDRHIPIAAARAVRRREGAARDTRRQEAGFVAIGSVLTLISYSTDALDIHVHWIHDDIQMPGTLRQRSS